MELNAEVAASRAVERRSMIVHEPVGIATEEQRALDGKFPGQGVLFYVTCPIFVECEIFMPREEAFVRWCGRPFMPFF